MTIQEKFPSIRPSLNLDFANTKTLDPRVTFSRTSTATYYDGKTVAKAEENLLIRSQEFDNAVWAKINTTVTPDSAVAPDGTTTAETIIASAITNNRAFVSQVFSSNRLIDTTISVFLKKDTAQYAWVSFTLSNGYDNRYAALVVDLDTGTITQSDGDGGGFNVVASRSVSDFGNGWYKIIITARQNVGSGNPAIYVGPSNTNTLSFNYSFYSSGLPIQTLSGGESIFIWGAQVEQRSSVTAYTPTTTQPITNYVPVLQTAAASVARFDHNPVTGESLGLLIEEQRTNLLTYSEQFDNAAWTKTNATVTANTVVAPDGTLTGDKLVEDTSTGVHQLAINFTFVTNTTYTFSLYVKQAERKSVSLSLGGTYGAAFNLETGQVTLVNVAGTWSNGSATITNVGNGAQKCVVTATRASGTQGLPLKISIGGTATQTSTGGESYTGDGYSGIYIWGAQLEAGAFPTSYIKTEASQVTRSADAASMTGTNFSSWFSQAEGTLYAEINPRALAASSGVVLNDNTISNRIRMATTSVSDQGTVTVSGSAQATLDGGTPAANTSMKLAMAYKADDFALSLNGGAVATDTVGTVPVVTQMQIGAETTAAGNLHVKKVAFYPKRLTNTQLQALTT